MSDPEGGTQRGLVRRLLESVRKGSETALNQLGDRFRPRARKAASRERRRHGLAGGDSEWVANGALYEVLRDAPDLPAGAGMTELERRLDRVVRERTIDHARRNRRYRHDSELGGVLEARAMEREQEPGAVTRADHLERIERLFESCGGRYTEVLKLRFIVGLEYGQIAERLGSTEEAVRKRVARVRLVLAEKLGERSGDES